MFLTKKTRFINDMEFFKVTMSAQTNTDTHTQLAFSSNSLANPVFNIPTYSAVVFTPSTSLLYKNLNVKSTITLMRVVLHFSDCSRSKKDNDLCLNKERNETPIGSS